MKKLLTLASTLTLFFTTTAQTTLDWAQKINQLSVSCSNTTSLGDLVIIGTFSGTVDFDPGTGTANLSANTPSGFSLKPPTDIFIAKYLSTGGLDWVKKIGNNEHELVRDLAIDKNNNIIIAGTVKNSVDVNPATAINNIGVSGKETYFIAKYTTDGSFTWVKTFNNIFIEQLATDNVGNIIATGNYRGTADFNPSTSVSNKLTASTNSDDIFVASYTATGAYSWAKSFGNNSPEEETINDLFVDANKNIYLTGTYHGTVDFNPSSSVSNLTSSLNVADVFFSKFKEDGSFVFAKTIACVENIVSKNILVDTEGSIYIEGIFKNKADFDPSSAVKYLTSFKPNTNFNTDIFIAKYSATGSYKWAKKIGNANTSIDNLFVQMQLTKNDNLLLYGSFRGTIDFNPNSPTYNLSSNPNTAATGHYHYSLYLLSLTKNGNFSSAYAIGNTTNNAIAYKLAVDKNHNQFYIMGTFLGTIDFNPSSITNNLTSISNNPNTFIAKYILPVSGIIPNEDDSEGLIENKSFVIEDATNGIKLYPNPASDNLTIEYNNFENTNPINIKIYDITGKEVSNYSMIKNNAASQINISNFEAGVYIITIQTQDKIIREKFIKQ